MLAIRTLEPKDLSNLVRLFEKLSPDSHWFHPHPMTIIEADRACSHISKDVYAGVFLREYYFSTGLIDTALVAYGMLRGWDAGFDVPSLGIAVHPEYRGKKISRTFMEYLHCTAALRGAKKVRLSVHSENIRAKGMYSSMGYVWEEEKDDQVVGFLTLQRKPE